MQKKYFRVVRRRKLIRLCIFIAAVIIIFTIWSPIRLAKDFKEANLIRKLIESSLFFELNPFVKDDAADASKIVTTTAALAEDLPKDEDIYVIDETLSDNSIYDVPPEMPKTAISLPQDSGMVSFRNETSIIPDVKKLLAMPNAFSIVGKGPHVLIIHTHSCEAYTPDSKNFYEPDDTDRTLDENFSVIRVGNELEKRLKDAGISVIHDKTVHDYPSYSGSYTRMLESLRKDLKSNSNIKIIIDLHRDAMISSDGVKHKTMCQAENADGTPLSSAQLMFVVGTNEGGLTHPKWQQNLSFAVKLQDTLNKGCPGLMRPINIRKERFNQHASTGSILLEVGSSGNTLDEALTAIKLFADGFTELIKKYK